MNSKKILNKKKSSTRTKYIDLYEIVEAEKSIIFKFKNNTEIVFDIINKKLKTKFHIDNIFVSKTKEYLENIISSCDIGFCDIKQNLVPIRLLGSRERNEIFLNSTKTDWIKKFFETGILFEVFNPIDILAAKKDENFTHILNNIELISKTKKLNDQNCRDFVEAIGKFLSIKIKNLNDIGIDSWFIENSARDNRLWATLSTYREIKKGKHLDLFRFLWTEYKFPFLKDILNLGSFKFLLKKGYKIKPLMQYLCKDVAKQGLIPIIQDKTINDVNYYELLGDKINESDFITSLRDASIDYYCDDEDCDVDYPDNLLFNSYTMDQLIDYVKLQADDNFEKFPKYLETEISSLKYKLKIKESKKIENNFDKIKENLKKFEYFGEKYCIIAPKSSKDILTEGYQLEHCVGGYVEDIIKGKAIILFMRNNLIVETPFITVHVKKSGQENYNLIMCRGRYNRFPNEEEKLFLIQYAKHFKFNIIKNSVDDYFHKIR